MIDGVIIGDDQTVKTELTLENIREEIAVAMHLYATPRRVAGHHSEASRPQRGQVRVQVLRAQLVEAASGVAVIAYVERGTREEEEPRARAVCSAAIGDKVLEARSHRHSRLLEAIYLRRATRCDRGRVLGEALVGASPSQIMGYSDARREGPVDTTRVRLARRERRELADERDIEMASLIAQAALPYVVWDQRGAAQIILAVHRIVAYEKGYAGR